MATGEGGPGGGGAHDDGDVEEPELAGAPSEGRTFPRMGTLAELTLGLNVGGTDDGFLGYNSDGPGSV